MHQQANGCNHGIKIIWLIYVKCLFLWFRLMLVTGSRVQHKKLAIHSEIVIALLIGYMC